MAVREFQLILPAIAQGYINPVAGCPGRAVPGPQSLFQAGLERSGFHFDCRPELFDFVDLRTNGFNLIWDIMLGYLTSEQFCGFRRCRVE
jgi:hypothetical protein